MIELDKKRQLIEKQEQLFNLFAHYVKPQHHQILIVELNKEITKLIWEL